MFWKSNDYHNSEQQDMLAAPASMEKLKWIMSELRDPLTGCPWDLKQDFASIVPHTIEEAYEVADAITNATESGDYAELEKELGDLLFQVVFYSQLGQEQQRFDFDSVVAAICEKLIRRHPHVFSDTQFGSEQDIKANWENEKAKERAEKQREQKQRAEKQRETKQPEQSKEQQLEPEKEVSILADIPSALPALSQANKIQKRCAHVGFDWQNISDVVAKVEEEVIEVKEHIVDGDINEPDKLSEELGDLMFAVVNLCRHAKQDPEAILRKANQKFTKRFQQVEQQVAESEKPMSEHDLASLEAFWQKVKTSEVAESASLLKEDSNEGSQ